MRKKIRQLLINVVRPVICELPIVMSFLIFTKSWGYLFSIVQFLLGIERAEDLGFYSSIEYAVGSLSIWFVVSYVVATFFYLRHGGGKILYYLSLVIFFLISRFCILNFGLDVSPQMLTLIAETNGRETTEFFNTYLLTAASIRCYAETAIFSVVCVLMELFYPKLLKKKHLCPKVEMILSAMVIVVLIYGVLQFQWYYKILQYDGNNIDELVLMRRPANDSFSNTLYAIKYISVVSKEQNKAIQVSLNMGKADCVANDSVTVILVIGESYIKYHSYLYGYSLNTTPICERERDNGHLFVFNDVITPFNGTSLAIKNLMSCNSVSNGERWCNYPYFPTIFKKAGFNVYMWDNQREMDISTMYTFSLNSYLYNPSLAKTTYTNTSKGIFQYDGMLIDDFSTTYPKQASRHNLVIFHLQGQHVDPSTRYPHEAQFQIFSKDSYNRREKWITEAKRQKIADYDNATYYNDYVIGKIIDHFRNTKAVFLYLSDHGEEVYDYRDHMGRDASVPSSELPLKYQYDIPFLIWCSNSYMTTYPENIEHIRLAINRPFMSDNICHVLFHLAGIRTGFYRAGYDVLSPQYVPRHRFVGDARLDYDQIMGK